MCSQKERRFCSFPWKLHVHTLYKREKAMFTRGGSFLWVNSIRLRNKSEKTIKRQKRLVKLKAIKINSLLIPPAMVHNFAAGPQLRRLSPFFYTRCFCFAVTFYDRAKLASCSVPTPTQWSSTVPTPQSNTGETSGRGATNSFIVAAKTSITGRTRTVAGCRELSSLSTTVGRIFQVR